MHYVYKLFLAKMMGIKLNIHELMWARPCVEVHEHLPLLYGRLCLP